MPTQPLALPTDYYELLDVAPAHLFPVAPVHLPGRPQPPDRHPDDLLPAADVDQAALLAERNAVSEPTLSPAARAVRLLEIEIGRRILRDPLRRRRYDALRTPAAATHPRADRLQALRELQEQVRDEIANERGDPLALSDEAGSYEQGMAALRRGAYEQARTLLQRAAAVQPESAIIQLAFVRASIAAVDPLTLSGFALRELAQAVERAAGNADAAPLHQLIQGLQAREQGDRYGARKAFQAAVSLQANLAPAWHALAAVALADQQYEAALEAAERACAADNRNQSALTILVVAAQHLKRRDRAINAAGRIAELRGGSTTAAQILRELQT